MKDVSLEDRMKVYEMCQNINFTENLPIIVRLDGRAFHTLTRKLIKPFDNDFIDMMNNIAIDLCENDLQNIKLAYLQSDEISFLLYKKPLASSWFGNNIQKIVSVVSARASSYATLYNQKSANYGGMILPDKPIMFDCRTFVLPEKEVCNYFLWRQRDWTRNSLQMLARKYYSQKQLNNKNQADMQEMIFKKNDNWNDLPIYLKRGRCIISEGVNNTWCLSGEIQGEVSRRVWKIDDKIPIFSKDRKYIEKYLVLENGDIK